MYNTYIHVYIYTCMYILFVFDAIIFKLCFDNFFIINFDCMTVTNVIPKRPQLCVFYRPIKLLKGRDSYLSGNYS